MRLDPDLVPFLESGCALVLGSVGPDGRPFASRGWGLDVLDADAGRIRVLVVADERPAAGTVLAVTGTSVVTLRSMQMKGAVVEIEPTITDADLDRSARYRDEFLGDIVGSDGTPIELLSRMLPVGPLAAVQVVVDELFDQTPGPGAGASIRP